MNKPVSYKLAKLLKEKGFDLSTERFYPKPKCKLFGIDEHGRHYPIVNKTQTYYKGEAAVLKEENYYDAPTIAEVVMWLYEKHGIWIGVYDLDDTTIFRHCFSNIDFNSPTDAYSSAIEYTLNNLI